jgi:hypothetical protein
VGYLKGVFKNFILNKGACWSVWVASAFIEAVLLSQTVLNSLRENISVVDSCMNENITDNNTLFASLLSGKKRPDMMYPSTRCTQ